MNTAHSDHIKRINSIQKELGEIITTRKAIGMAIHDLASIRKTHNNDLKDKMYATVIDRMYKTMYEPLTRQILVGQQTIRKLKLETKLAQRNFDKYSWVKEGATVAFVENDYKYFEGTALASVGDYADTLNKPESTYIPVRVAHERKFKFPFHKNEPLYTIHTVALGDLKKPRLT